MAYDPACFGIYYTHLCLERQKKGDNRQRSSFDPGADCYVTDRVNWARSGCNLRSHESNSPAQA